jgi:hypothetical protein
MPDQDYDDVLEETYEVDGVEMTGFEFLSNAYGIACREEQFQDFYDSFSTLQRYLSTGSFREGTGRVEEAVEDFVESANDYLGLDYSESEFAADYSFLTSANGGAIPEHSERILEEISGTKGSISEDEMREIVKEVREEF